MNTKSGAGVAVRAGKKSMARRGPSPYGSTRKAFQRARSAALAAAQRAYTASRSGWRMRRLYSRSSSGSIMARASDAEIGFAHGVVGAQSFGRAVEHGPAALEHDAAIGMRQRHVRVLLGDEHREALRLQGAQRVEHLVHHQRC